MQWGSTWNDSPWTLDNWQRIHLVRNTLTLTFVRIHPCWEKDRERERPMWCKCGINLLSHIDLWIWVFASIFVRPDWYDTLTTRFSSLVLFLSLSPWNNDFHVWYVYANATHLKADILRVRVSISHSHTVCVYMFLHSFWISNSINWKKNI